MSQSQKLFDPYSELIDFTNSPATPARAPRSGRTPLVVSDSDSDEIGDTPTTTQRPVLSHPTFRSQFNALHQASFTPQPLSSAARGYNNMSSQPKPIAGDEAFGFGASILKSKKPRAPATPKGYGSYIKPATSGAFRQSQPQSQSSPFHRQGPAAGGYRDGWPTWAHEGSSSTQSSQVSNVSSKSSSQNPPREKEEVDQNGEEFDLGAAQFTADDFERCQGDPEEQMRELLAGAVGDGEDEGDDDGEGSNIVEGFADSMKLMPHQVRGVKWMRERETGRKYGGILADDMGLGKTVQTLARIVEGKPTAAEKRVYKGGTLIIAPLAVMEQWATECRTKTQPGLLKVATHHGAGRVTTGKELEKYDVVITTFQILSSEFNALTKAKPTAESDEDSDSDAPPRRRTAKAKAKPKHALFDLKWLRVVIDEAQNIKNHKTQAAKAAVELRAKYRWCLTGTPIQNNVEELYSLFKFLRARPLDDWQVFRARVSSLVKEGRTGVAMKRLHVILKAIMLRRTKDATIDGKPILNLPGRFVNVVDCPFDEDERAFYESLEKKTAMTFNKFMKSGSVMSNYTSVLTMLLRLRQACDHPSLVTKSLVTDQDAIANQTANTTADESDDELADLLGGLAVAKEQKCDICFVVLQDQTAKQCPECAEITHAKLAPQDALPPSSAKIRMLIKLITEVDERSQNKEKTIVFSQFTSFLDLIEPFFKREGIDYVRYDGSLRADQRSVVLEKIRTSTKTRVILISFKAGSTGLNLTCCNNVILCDLWWNPALEDQAFDRAHRLGQKLDVNISKLTVKDTVEDRILELQTSKRELAQAALSGQGGKNLKLSMADIMKLFQRSSDVE